MLLLTRKAGQAVMVGNTIRIKVVELSAGTVRLGIEAPAEISIYRQEIYEAIAAANRTALSTSAVEPPEDPEDGAHGT